MSLDKKKRKMELKKAVRVVLGLIFIVAMTFGVYRYFKNLTEKEEGFFSFGKTKEEESESAPLPVRVSNARMGELIMKLKTIGEVEAIRIVKIKSDLKGEIKKLWVDEGTHAKKGEILAELDDTEYRLKLEEAEANRLEKLSRFYVENQFGEITSTTKDEGLKKIDSKKNEYEKALELWKDGLISEKELEKKKREYELSIIEKGERREDILSSSIGFSQADIAYKQAKINLEKTKIKAPFSGIITDLKVRENHYVNPGEEIMTLVNVDRLRVKAKILESEIGKIVIGRRATLKFSSYPEKIFYGKLISISPVVDPNEKTCNVFIDLENPGELIKPGMHCEVAIDSEIHKGKLIIPREAILVRGERKLCFVVEGELAKWRYVETGLEDDTNVEILSGVSEGEEVIVEGHFILAHDAKVRVLR